MGGCVRGSSTPPLSAESEQASTVRQAQGNFRVGRQGRQTRQIIQRNNTALLRHCLPATVIGGGHASTDAVDGSSSEHLLPRRATAACVRGRACCCSTAHATGEED